MGIFKMTEDGLDYKDADDLYEEQQEYSQYNKEEADYYSQQQERYYADLAQGEKQQ